VPAEGTDAHAVLEEEKRSDSMLEGVKQVCSSIADMQRELRTAWQHQRATFVQRLREVSYIQSKVRDVERQAVVLEEEVNSQRTNASQLDHLRRMPKAYQKMLVEVARRQEFRDRYAAQCEHFRSLLGKMMEDENGRRRDFMKHYGCHLPAELMHGLGSLVPAASVEISDFDTSLPEIDFGSLEDGRHFTLTVVEAPPSGSTNCAGRREADDGYADAVGITAAPHEAGAATTSSDADRVRE